MVCAYHGLGFFNPLMAFINAFKIVSNFFFYGKYCGPHYIQGNQQ